MYLLKVGEPYVAGKHSFAPVTNYNFRGGQHELLLILDRLTDRDIEAARKAEAEFALVIHRRVLFLLYRFGEAFQWSDAPYSIWLLPEHERLHPQVGGPDSRALLTVILVRAEDGIVQGLRGLTLPPMLTAELQRAIGEQFSSPLSIREYMRRRLRMRTGNGPIPSPCCRPLWLAAKEAHDQSSDLLRPSPSPHLKNLGRALVANRRKAHRGVRLGAGPLHC